MSGWRRLAVVALCVLPCLAAAAELGRLFLSAAERLELNRLRQSAGANPSAAANVGASMGSESAVGAAAPPPAGSVTVNGYIVRSAGAPTVWVNGADAGGADLSALGVDSRRIRIDAAQVRLPRTDGSGTHLSLKPGQSFDTDSQHVSDAYERRSQP